MTEKNIQVSILIVSYNTKDLLIKCIKSIEKHVRGVTYEVIVVDNASTDKSADNIKKQFPWVNVIKNKHNTFFTKANNQAFKLSSGKYVLFLAPDAWFVDNAVYKMVSYLQKNPRIGACEGLEIYENGNLVPNGSRDCSPLIDFYELSILGKRLKNKKSIKWYRYQGKDRKLSFNIEVGCDAFIMIRREVFEKVRGFDEKLLMYYTENDLCLRIRKEGYKIMHLGFAQAHHKVTAVANTLKWKKLDIYYSDLLTYYKKHGFLISGISLFILLKFEQLLLRLFRPRMFE